MWRRTRARAVWTFFDQTGVTSFSERQTAGGEANGPSSLD